MEQGAMGYFLGIDVGAERTVAAVARDGSDDVETVDLGEGADGSDGPADGVASVLHLGADGVLAVGAAAQEWAPREPDRVVAGFPGRIGDEAMMLAGEPWAPEELTAWLVRWVVDRVAAREGGPAAAVAVSHPPSWGADRTRLLGDALAEQELEVAFLAPSPGGGADADEDGDDEVQDDRGHEAAAARTAARALRAAAVVAPSAEPPIPAPRSIDGAGSGRHAAVAAAEEPADQADGGPAVDGDAGAPADDAEDGGPDGRDWEVPAPRRAEPAPPPADPATAHLDPLGFTGGMGATNTAGLLSGYTPPHGTPALWSGGAGATGAAGTMTATSSVTSSSVALPAQRAGSGRYRAVAPAEDLEPAAQAPPLRARNNPTVLVGAGGLAAAVAVVATLFLWPAPPTTNSATRPVAAVPAATAAEPSASTVPLTPAPEPPVTRRPRPQAPRTHRPVVPPVSASIEPTDSTAPPTDSTEPTEPTTSAPASTEPTAPTTTSTKHHDN